VLNLVVIVLIRRAWGGDVLREAGRFAAGGALGE
jgi:hypothetical protein